jgi:glycosyltransferase involved in cell wall biosynthesis
MSAKEEKEEPLIHVLEIAGNAIVGGMERYVYNLSQHLPALGFKITCLVPYESPFTAGLRDLGCEVFITAMDDDPAWRSIQFTTELIKHQRIDLVHAHLPKAHILAGLAGRLANVPIVATVHGMEITGHELGICRTTGSHITVVCQGAFSQAMALGAPEERLSLIPNGVDTKVFTPTSSGASFRRAQLIPADVPLVGFVGRLAWEKGPDQFVQMAEYIHKQNPEVHFVMVGEGPFEEEVRAMVQSARLDDCMHITGLLTDTWEVYCALDLLAQTSRVEGMPFSLLEAMACGTPVAAMAVGGIAEIIEVGTTGYLSAGGDWSGLGEAVLKALSNPEKRRQMGQEARKRVETYFDLRNSTRSMANLFQRLVDESQPAAGMFEPSWPKIENEREPSELNQTSAFTKRK